MRGMLSFLRMNGATEVQPLVLTQDAARASADAKGCPTGALVRAAAAVPAAEVTSVLMRPEIRGRLMAAPDDPRCWLGTLVPKSWYEDAVE